MQMDCWECSCNDSRPRLCCFCAFWQTGGDRVPPSVRKIKENILDFTGGNVPRHPANNRRLFGRNNVECQIKTSIPKVFLQRRDLVVCLYSYCFGATKGNQYMSPVDFCLNKHFVKRSGIQQFCIFVILHQFFFKWL